MYTPFQISKYILFVKSDKRNMNNMLNVKTKYFDIIGILVTPIELQFSFCVYWIINYTPVNANFLVLYVSITLH